MLKTVHSLLQDCRNIVLLSLPLACALWGLLAMAPLRRFVVRSGDRISVMLALAGVLAHTGYSLHYIVTPSLGDHVEPAIVLLARQGMEGRSIYHDLDSASRYLVQYGPNTYLAPLFSLKVLGDSTVSVKKLSAGFALGALVMVILAVCQIVSRAVARAAGILYFLLIAHAHGEIAIWASGPIRRFFFGPLPRR